MNSHKKLRVYKNLRSALMNNKEEKKLIEEKQSTESPDKKESKTIIVLSPIKIELNDLIDFLVCIISIIFLVCLYKKYFPIVIPLSPLSVFYWNSVGIYNNLFKHVFVSAFFPIKEGVIRHPLEFYKRRANLLFDTFSQHEKLYVFTSKKGKKFLLSIVNKNKSNTSNENNSTKFRSIKPNIKFITKYQKAFDIPKIAQYKKKYYKIANLMNKTEKYPISAEIGAIWNSKLVFLQEVIDSYEPTAQMIFWVDIGLIKTDEFFSKNIPYIWPSTKRIEKIFYTNFSGEVKLKEKIIFTIKKDCLTFSGKSLSSLPLNTLEFILAGFFGGERETLKSFLSEYWNYHDFYLKRYQYVLREEKIMTAYSIFNQDKVLFIHLKKCNCYIFLSSLAFTSQYNLCNCSNNVYSSIKSKRGLCTQPIQLGSWL